MMQCASSKHFCANRGRFRMQLRQTFARERLPQNRYHWQSAAGCKCANYDLPTGSVPEWMQRTELIMGTSALRQLGRSTVTVVGLGGIGSWCAEALCRGGVGTLVLIDGDVVDSSNRNRQLPALNSTIGSSKVDVMVRRLKDINPDVNIIARHQFLDPQAARELAKQPCDYIVDCIDSVTPKVELVATAIRQKQPVLSCMGAGGKLSPGLVRVADISKTEQDGLAKVVRVRLRKKGIRHLKCVFSPENPVKGSVFEVPHSQGGKYKRSYYGTMSYMPAVFGMHAAAFVIKRVAAKRTSTENEPLTNEPLTNGERTPSDVNETDLEGYLYVI